MTSYRQIEANRRNALKSTGPKTEAGKQASRCNAVRHGLTAETVIGALGGLPKITRRSRQPLRPIMMHNRRSSANSSCDWLAYYGGCAVPR